MKYLFLLALVSCLSLAACADKSENAGSTNDVSMSTDPNDPALLRPDALNPVNDNFVVPLGWKYRFDDAAADVTVGTDADSFDVFFVTMKPGWHVTTTQGSGIFWHPASTADGAFSVSSGMHLFAPGQRNEGFGLIFGGHNLEGPDQSYLYFLLRRSGEFLVKRRIGDETETLVGWEPNDAINPYTEETEGTVLNTLAVHVGESTLAFFVNDIEVHSMPKDALVTDGIVGFRLNHGLNVHIETFEVVEGE